MLDSRYSRAGTWSGGRQKGGTIPPAGVGKRGGGGNKKASVNESGGKRPTVALPSRRSAGDKPRVNAFSPKNKFRLDLNQ